MAVTGMVERLESAGAEVVELSLPSIEYALSAYYLIAPAECSANLARFDGVRFGLRRDGETDRQRAVDVWFDAQSWSYLIVEVAEGQVASWNSWVLDKEQFHHEEAELVDG